MKITSYLLALMLMCSAAMAEGVVDEPPPDDPAAEEAEVGAPVPKIEGPTERHPGALTFLDASGSSATKFKWTVDTRDVIVPSNGTPDVSQMVNMLRAMDFTVDPPKDKTEPLWAVSSDRKRLWLSSYPGLYRVTLAVSNSVGVDILPWEVRVSGDVPIPVPVPVPIPVPVPPQPIPVPVPPTPVPTDSLAQLTMAVESIPAARMQFGQVALAYEGIADQIKSGYLDTPVKVNAFTTVLVTAAAGTYMSEWAKIDTAIVKKYVATFTLTKAADYEPVWRAIGAAIKAGLVDIPPPVPVPPQPVPVPPQPVPVPPTPDPAPIPVSDWRVLFLYDDTKNLSAAQIGVLNSAPLMTWMKDQGVKWRIWPINVDASMEDAGWRGAIPTRKGDGPCWLIVSNGKTGFNGTMPTSVDDVKTLVLKYKP